MSDPIFVYIKGGKHKGKTLQFVKCTEKKIGVKDGSGDKIIYLNPEHVDMTNVSVHHHHSNDGNGLNANGRAIRPVTPIVRDNNNDASYPITDSTPNTDSNGWVRITNGKHEGKILRFVKRTPQRVAVERDDGKIIYLDPNHVDTRKISNNADDNDNPFVRATTSHPVSNATATNSKPSATTWVRIIKGKHQGKILRFVERTTKRVAVERDEDGKIIYLDPDHVENVNHNVANAVPSFQPIVTDDEGDESFDFVSAVEDFMTEDDDDNDRFFSTADGNTNNIDDHDPMCEAIQRQLPATYTGSIKNVTDSILDKTYVVSFSKRTIQLFLT